MNYEPGGGGFRIGIEQERAAHEFNLLAGKHDKLRAENKRLWGQLQDKTNIAEALRQENRELKDRLDEQEELQTCGHHDPPQEIYCSDSTAFCTMGQGWCPIHGSDCPVK